MCKKVMVLMVLSSCIFTPLQGWAQPGEENPPPPILRFGAGVLATFTQNLEFPTGVSARLWILRDVGLEVDVFTRENNPTFALRAFYRFVDIQTVSLYTGGGAAFFSEGLIFDSTLQAVVGIEIAISSNLLFSAEVGAVLGGSAAIPVSAAAGVHYYF